jgi:hypothetical protein
MTTKEKAAELFRQMYLVKDPMNGYPMCFDTAKQCALIAVDLAIEYNDFHIEFLQEVKQEINLL